VHGGASSNRQWKALVEALKPEFRVLAPNLYGAGEMPAWPGPGRYSLADAARLVCNLCDGDERVNLVGHSFGAVVAMEAAAILGERVSRLVLLEPGAYAMLRYAGDPAFQPVVALHAGVSECLRRDDWQGVAACFMRAFAGEAAWEAMPPERQRRVADSVRHTVHEWDALLDDPRTLEDWRRALPARTLLASAPDTWPPLRAIAAHLRRARPDWTDAEIASGGHMAPITRPDLVNPLVASFLAA
jgi:pimeloyl-ACP methyl ester carboxylesterase